MRQDGAGRAYRQPRKTRTARCESCNCTWKVTSRAGPLPRRCKDCDPRAAASREHERRKYVRRTHPEVVALREKLAAARRTINSRTTMARRTRRERDEARAQLAALTERFGRVGAAAALRYREERDEARRLLTERPVALRQSERGGILERPDFGEVEARGRTLGPPGYDSVRRGVVRLARPPEGVPMADIAEDLACALWVWAHGLRARPTDIEKRDLSQTPQARYDRRKRAEAREVREAA